MKTLILVSRTETTYRVPDDTPEDFFAFLDWGAEQFDIGLYVTGFDSYDETVVVVDTDDDEGGYLP